MQTCGSPAPRPSPRRSGAAAAWGPRLPRAPGVGATGSVSVTRRPARFSRHRSGLGWVTLECRVLREAGCVASLSEPDPTMRPFLKCRCPFERSLQCPGSFAEVDTHLPVCDPGWGEACVFIGSVEGSPGLGGCLQPLCSPDAPLGVPRSSFANPTPATSNPAGSPGHLQNASAPILRQVELFDRIISCK